MLRFRFAPLCFLSLTPSIAVASIYVVDPQGGPGVDFTDMPAAIASAQVGDVFRVHAGNYHAFTLSIGVTILADAGAAANFDVVSLPSGQRAIVSGLRFGTGQVDSSSGHVLLENLTGLVLAVHSSVDVRLRGCTGLSVLADASRVEVTSSSLVGAHGDDGCDGTGCGTPHYEGYPGGAALTCTNGSIVHVGATDFVGGTGGAGGYQSFCPNFPGGNGGDGIRVESGSILVTGSGTETIAGNTGGTGWSNPNCAPAVSGVTGNAIDVQAGVVLESGVVVQGTVTGSSTLVAPADPCLRVSGAGVAGTPLVYTLNGAPGDQARLRLGRQMVLNHLPNVFEDQLTNALRSYTLGVIPPSGITTLTLNVPASLPPGFVIVAQGSTTSPSGQTRLTQSAPVVVR